MKWAAFLFVAALAACNAPPAQQTHADEPVQAEAATPGALGVSGAWARPTPGGADVAAGYVTLANSAAADDQLLSASSPRAAHVMVHVMEMSGGMMNMHDAPDGLTVPAGGQLALAPGGAHLMFTGLTKPFELGEAIPVTLTFAHAGAIETTLVVADGPPPAERPRP